MKNFILIFSLYCHAQFAAEPIICLNMIVKNESAIIERCLTHAKDIVDCISICDTGSTDNTVEIIEQFLQKNKIPGKVYRHKWKNFEYNRTLSAKAAEQTMKELSFSSPNRYLLLLDADMVLHTTPEFKKEQLCSDSYHVEQKSTSTSCYNIHLIKSSLPWDCVGVCHEYWSYNRNLPPEKLPIQKLQTLWIQDLEDGGCKKNKLERDIKLLTTGLQEEPNNIRYMFYLAQSYKDLKKYDKALEWYKKRISQGGWIEEIWYSKFMIGSIHEELGKWDLALSAYVDAYQYHPSRAEPLSKIARHYRLTGDNGLAYLFATEGKKIPYPHQQLLFIDNEVYQYRLDEDISITAYYTTFKEEGFAANEQILLKKEIPENIKLQAINNLRFYAKNLPNIRFQPVSLQLPLYLNPTNPSIVKTENGYLVTCRCVNYKKKGAKTSLMLDPEMKQYLGKSRNFLLHYDKDFHLISQKEIIDTLSESQKIRPYGSTEGLEDLRLFKYKEQWWFTCTTLDMTPYHIPQMGLFQLSNTSEKTSLSTESFFSLSGPDPSLCEKNWLPFVKNGVLHAIYSYDPFIIYKIDPLKKTCEQIQCEEQQYNFSNFRGSASPIPFDDGYLLLIHQISLSSEGRVYLHKFLYLNKDFKITHASRPFIYQHHGIEFCCGMTIDHLGSNLIMSIGVDDAQAFLAFVDLQTVRSLLKPL